MIISVIMHDESGRVTHSGLISYNLTKTSSLFIFYDRDALIKVAYFVYAAPKSMTTAVFSPPLPRPSNKGIFSIEVMYQVGKKRLLLCKHNADTHSIRETGGVLHNGCLAFAWIKIFSATVKTKYIQNANIFYTFTCSFCCTCSYVFRHVNVFNEKRSAWSIRWSEISSSHFTVRLNAWDLGGWHRTQISSPWTLWAKVASEINLTNGYF